MGDRMAHIRVPSFHSKSMDYEIGIPRAFSPLPGIELRDMGWLKLAPDEQITLWTDTGKRNDIVRKKWGFYLGNSLNATLRDQGFKTALVISHASTPPRLFLNLVEKSEIAAFERYLIEVNARVACWLDEWLTVKAA